MSQFKGILLCGWDKGWRCGGGFLFVVVGVVVVVGDVGLFVDAFPEGYIIECLDVDLIGGLIKTVL